MELNFISIVSGIVSLLCLLVADFGCKRIKFFLTLNPIVQQILNGFGFALAIIAVQSGIATKPLSEWFWVPVIVGFILCLVVIGLNTISHLTKILQVIF